MTVHSFTAPPTADALAAVLADGAVVALNGNPQVKVSVSGTSVYAVTGDDDNEVEVGEWSYENRDPDSLTEDEALRLLADDILDYWSGQ